MGLVIRAASLLLLALGGTAEAADGMLRGDVQVTRDVLTVRDLVDGAPPAIAETPLFRAPALGASGTIQARRIVAAAEALGLSVQTGGRMQVTITRAARQVGAVEIEAALRKRIVDEYGLDPAATGIAFDGQAPVLAASPELLGEATASELAYDRRTRRVSAAIWLGPSHAERRAQIRVTGSVIDLVEVVVAAKPLERGHTVKAGDLVVERRPKDALGPDAPHDGAILEGRVLRRSAGAGMLLKPADLIRPEIVARGDLVSVSYEVPGVALTMRMTANVAGALGDTITVTNPQSKKVLQAVVTGPGRAAVGAPPPGRVASAERPMQ